MRPSQNQFRASLAIILAVIVVIGIRSLQQPDVPFPESVFGEKTVAEPIEVISWWSGATRHEYTSLRDSDQEREDTFNYDARYVSLADNGTLVFLPANEKGLTTPWLYDPQIGSVPFPAACNYPSISPDARVIVCVKGGDLLRYDRESQQLVTLYADPQRIITGAPSAYNQTVIVPQDSGDVLVIDANTGNLLNTLANDGAMVWNDDGTMNAQGSAVGKIRLTEDIRGDLWNESYNVRGNEVTPLAFSEERGLLLVSSLNDDGSTTLVQLGLTTRRDSILTTFQTASPFSADYNTMGDVLALEYDGEIFTLRMDGQTATDRTESVYQRVGFGLYPQWITKKG